MIKPKSKISVFVWAKTADESALSWQPVKKHENNLQ